MKNLIVNAFAFKEEYQTSLQIGGSTNDKLIELYMKNIFVSLKSAKVQNPEDDVMLITNCEIPPEYGTLFQKNNISVQIIPFDSFVMPREFVWSLAFFKLCALTYIINHLDYEKYLLIDADTITVQSYKELWEEAEYGVLLFPVGHSFHHRDREYIRQDYQILFPQENKNIVHYGGEFLCGKRGNLIDLQEKCQKVYEIMKLNGYPIAKNAGDETILSIAAAEMSNIIAAVPYIYRYWTNAFYLVSTNTLNNPVAIWHVPDEKKQGFVYLFQFYQKKGCFPKEEKLMEIFGIHKAKRPFNYYTLRGKIERKINR